MSSSALLPGVGLLLLFAPACGGAPRVAPAPPSLHVPESAPLVAAPAPPVPAPVELLRSPSFPAGWIPGAAPSPLAAPPAPGARSLQALAAQRAPQRRPLPQLTELALAELPLALVGPEPDWSKEPTAIPSTDEAPELFFDWRPSSATRRDVALAAGGASGASATIEVRKQRFGFFDLNFFSSFTLPDEPGGLGALCGLAGGTGYRRASWQSLTVAEGGAIRVEGAEAWFDYHTCKAHVMQRIDSLARPFAGGLAYAFRTRCPTCADQAEELHVITPEQGWSASNRSEGFHTVHGGSPFGHIAISLRPGAAGSRAARVTVFALERFKKLGAPLDRTKAAILGMEVTRAAAEAEPTALFYVIDAPPE